MVNTPQPARKKLHIKRTKGEWALIEKKLKKMGKPGLHQYLHSEVHKLNRLYKECPQCVSAGDGQKQIVRHQIPEPIYEMLAELSIKMHKPISNIIDDLLITPLLLPDRDSAV